MLTRGHVIDVDDDDVWPSRGSLRHYLVVDRSRGRDQLKLAVGRQIEVASAETGSVSEAVFIAAAETRASHATEINEDELIADSEASGVVGTIEDPLVADFENQRAAVQFERAAAAIIGKGSHRGGATDGEYAAASVVEGSRRSCHDQAYFRFQYRADAHGVDGDTPAAIDGQRAVENC